MVFDTHVLVCRYAMVGAAAVLGGVAGLKQDVLRCFRVLARLQGMQSHNLSGRHHAGADRWNDIYCPLHDCGALSGNK